MDISEPDSQHGQEHQLLSSTADEVPALEDVNAEMVDDGTPLPDVSAVSIREKVPFQTSVLNMGAFAVERALMSPDINVNRTDTGTHPLNVAIDRSDTETVMVLLSDRRTDPNFFNEAHAANGRGQTASLLDNAISRASLSITRLLLGDHRTDPNVTGKLKRPPLQSDDALRWPEGLRLLLSHPKLDTTVKNSLGQNALAYSLFVNHGVCSPMLLEDGRFDPNEQDNFGRTALHTACLTGNAATIKLLLEDPRTNVTLKNNDLQNALHIAAKLRVYSVADLLTKDPRFDPDDVDKDGFTAFELAVDHSDPNSPQFARMFLPAAKPEEIQKYLACQGPSGLLAHAHSGSQRQRYISLVDTIRASQEVPRLPYVACYDEAQYMEPTMWTPGSGETLVYNYAPIMSCVEFGDEDALKTMLDANVHDPNQPFLMEHPLTLAARGQPNMVERLLRDHRINPAVTNIFRQNALMIAALSQQRDIVNILLKDGRQNLLAKDINGRNALHCAVAGGDMRIAQTILRAMKGVLVLHSF